MSVCSCVWVESSPTVHYDLCTTAKVTEGGMAKCSALFCCCCTLITRGFRRPRKIRILSAGFFKPDYFRSLVAWLDRGCKLSVYLWRYWILHVVLILFQLQESLRWLLYDLPFVPCRYCHNWFILKTTWQSYRVFNFLSLMALLSTLQLSYKVRII